MVGYRRVALMGFLVKFLKQESKIHQSIGHVGNVLVHAGTFCHSPGHQRELKILFLNIASFCFFSHCVSIKFETIRTERLDSC